jgi:hypothetical protein
MAVSIACLGFISKPDGKPILACYKNLNLQLKTEFDESKLTLRKIRPGETVSLQQFRQKIADAQACYATCPVSTSIFLRIVAEYAWEEHKERHVPPADLPPFWRVVEPGTPLSKRLSFDAAWIGLQRNLEKEL